MMFDWIISANVFILTITLSLVIKRLMTIEKGIRCIYVEVEKLSTFKGSPFPIKDFPELKKQRSARTIVFKKAHSERMRKIWAKRKETGVKLQPRRRKKTS
jgi:hypothetical protein